jgi:Kdo2-lipid IVA lauroyltransferase/acyltransferase
MGKFKDTRRQLAWRFQAFAALTFFFVVRLLPFSWMRFCGKVLGSLLFMVPSQKKLVMANIQVAFPDMPMAEVKSLGRQSLIGMILVFCEMVWFHGDADKFAKYLVIPEYIKKKVLELNNNGRPTIFLPMHWGNWEVSTISLKMLDPNNPVTVIAKKQKNPYLDKHVMEGRRKSGFNFVDSKGAVRALVKALKAGESVGLLVDQNTKIHKGGTYGEFFGLPVTISKTAAMMAAKFNTNVYVYTCRRTQKGFEVYINELPQEPANYATSEELSQGILDIMENTVRDHPEQWIWLYERWNQYPQNYSHLKDKYPYYASMNEHEYHREG